MLLLRLLYRMMVLSIARLCVLLVLCRAAMAAEFGRPIKFGTGELHSTHISSRSVERAEARRSVFDEGHRPRMRRRAKEFTHASALLVHYTQNAAAAVRRSVAQVRHALV